MTKPIRKSHKVFKQSGAEKVTLSIKQKRRLRKILKTSYDDIIEKMKNRTPNFGFKFF